MLQAEISDEQTALLTEYRSRNEYDLIKEELDPES